MIWMFVGEDLNLWTNGAAARIFAGRFRGISSSVLDQV